MEITKSSTIPTPLFSNIIPNLIAVLHHTQSAEGVAAPQAKQALLQATIDLKSALAQAKDYAAALPGGELNYQEQDDLILMLEKVKDHKWQELLCFAHKATCDDNVIPMQASDSKMEIDSTASTPFGS